MVLPHGGRHLSIHGRAVERRTHLADAAANLRCHFAVGIGARPAVSAILGAFAHSVIIREHFTRKNHDAVEAVGSQVDVADPVGVGVPIVGGHKAEPVTIEQSFEISGFHLRFKEFQRNLDAGPGTGFTPELLGRTDLKAAAHDFRNYIPRLVKMCILRLDIDVPVDLVEIRHADISGDF